MATVVEAALQSTRVYLDYLTQQQRGVQMHDVSRKAGEEPTERFVNGALLYAYSYRIQRGLSLQPDTQMTYVPDESPSSRVSVLTIDYQRKDGSLLLGFPHLQNSVSGRVEVDYKWLVARLKTWLEDNGTRVRNPFADSARLQDDQEPPARNNWCDPTDQVLSPSHIDRWLADNAHSLPDLSDQQSRAVSSALSHACTYTWGPPGTGKTHHVLASAAGFLLSHRKRILIVAPTNNALDNALRAVLRLAPKLNIDPSLIIRLGIPTPEFLHDYPKACEDKAARTELAALNAQLAALQENLAGATGIEVLLQKRGRAGELTKKWLAMIADQEEKLRLCQASLQSLTSRVEAAQAIHTNHTQLVARLEGELKEVGIIASLFTSRKRDIARSLSVALVELVLVDKGIETLRRGLASEHCTQDEIQACLSPLAVQLVEARAQERRIDKEIASLRQKMSSVILEDLPTAIAQLKQEIAVLSKAKNTIETRLSEKLAIGVTLDTLVGRCASSGFRVDWVLLDEAAYAQVAKSLPLLSFGCPLAMFGDHKQLPPVCEADDKDAVVNAYWAQSVVNLEVVWENPADYSRIAACTDPPFRDLLMSSLSRSFRFGDDLARTLDRFVYNNIGLTGSLSRTTRVAKIEVLAEPGPSGKRRVNIAEARAVADVIRHLVKTDDAEDLAVLTPYKAQAEEIRRQLRAERLLHRVEVMNTHRAQGREWATVVFSAVDGTLQGCRPWFTDSKNDHGLVVLNTTVSRVKRQLILVVEQGFWASRKDQLLGALVAIASRLEI